MIIQLNNIMKAGIIQLEDYGIQLAEIVGYEPCN